MATLAVTGGTGFVGRHLLRIAVERGHHVRALTRRPQDARAGISWVQGALDSPESLARLCTGADAVIHVAGVVNARDKAGFIAGNEAGTRLMVEAAERTGTRRFLLVSTLAAREPALSIYGASKAAGERIVQSSALDWTIVRPPAVYGPGDTEMLALFQMVRAGIALVPNRGRFSVIEASDLARALLAITEAPTTGRTFEVDDATAGGFDHPGFTGLVSQALGRRPRIIGVAPRALMLAAAADTALARVAGRLPRLSFDRARYIAHPDWVARPDLLPPPDLWTPSVPAQEGVAATAAWYREQGWI